MTNITINDVIDIFASVSNDFYNADFVVNKGEDTWTYTDADDLINDFGDAEIVDGDGMRYNITRRFVEIVFDVYADDEDEDDEDEEDEED